MCGPIHQWNHLVLKFSLLEFLITVSIFSVFIDPFQFSIFSWFSLGRLYVSKNVSVFLEYPICWYIIFHNSLYGSLNFCYISYNVASFISDFMCLSVLSSFPQLFYLKGLLFFFLSFLKKNSCYSFVDFFCYYGLCFIYFCSYICYFLPFTYFAISLFFLWFLEE